MHRNEIIYALICMNNHVLSCLISMLSTHACTHHPISYFISYDRLSPSFCAFALLVASETILRSHVEVA